jgi:dolichyl-phosphate beta-glucosyltransferase
MKKGDLTLIIPTYHEEHRIGRSLEDLASFLTAHKEELDGVSVVLVDGGSEDKTRQIAMTKAELFGDFRVDNLGQKGKGRQIKYAMTHYEGRYLLFMDADMATPLPHLLEMAKHIDDGSKVVIGIRDLEKSHKGLVRKTISWGGNFLVQLLILPGIKDTQCGFKMFERDAARDVFSRSRMLGWSFDMEALAIARKRGYRIQTLPLPDWKDVAGGTFGAQASSAALQTLKDLFIIRMRLWMGVYKHPWKLDQRIAE